MIFLKIIRIYEEFDKIIEKPVDVERTLTNEVTNLTIIKYFEKTLSSNNLINIVTHFKWL